MTMLKAIYSTTHTPVPDAAYTSLYLAIIGQAAYDVTDKSISQHHRHTARAWLDANGISDAQLPHIKRAFRAWRREVEAI